MTVKKLKPKKDYGIVLLEGLKSEFKFFGDGLSHIKDKVDKIDKDVDRLKDDILEVKAELALIRHELKEKVGRDEFRFLEQRVLKLERNPDLTLISHYDRIQLFFNIHTSPINL